jgi:MscS family membrane protein
VRPTEIVLRLRGMIGWGSLVVVTWVLGSLIVGVALSWLTRRLLTRLGARTTRPWDDRIVGRLGGPLTIGWALTVAYLGLDWIDLSTAADAAARRLLKGTFVATFFWVLLRGIDVADHLITSSPWATQRLASRSFVALGGKVVKIAVVMIGAVTILSQAGYPVGSLIAGLGIGGLALALAAQKTVENVFGAFSLAVDEPFRNGDLVKIDGVLGTVENIGLRSTRLRTPDRTLVTIPNGKLAEMRTESYAARDRLRLACTLGLVHETTAAQMRRVLAEIESALRAHPKIWSEAVAVCFKEITPSSLDIEVGAWFLTEDWAEFTAIRQEMLLRFMEVVEGAGTAFAFPTRTVHLVRDQP